MQWYGNEHMKEPGHTQIVWKNYKDNFLHPPLTKADVQTQFQQRACYNYYSTSHPIQHTCSLQQYKAAWPFGAIMCIPADEVHLLTGIKPALSNVYWKCNCNFAGGNVHRKWLSQLSTWVRLHGECIVHLIRDWLLEGHCDLLTAFVV